MTRRRRRHPLSHDAGARFAEAGGCFADPRTVVMEGTGQVSLPMISESDPRRHVIGLGTFRCDFTSFYFSVAAALIIEKIRQMTSEIVTGIFAQLINSSMMMFFHYHPMLSVTARRW